MIENELKPCPFCGSNNIKVDFRAMMHIEEYGVGVTCYNCYTRGPGTDCFHTDEKVKRNAVKAWNRRATTPQRK
ncbi:Lar family restriction alleviation protein [Xenorhabdus bovienii]|uniref:Lar family restriction alleviation protein n=1 Tax=Xenorhabdus bovienii TaxID=40576 RepID=UPI002A731566|nr:Lar family restriction alleviation protein [Xenorhabdus bovienii]